MRRRIFASISLLLLLPGQNAWPITSGWPALEREFQSTVQIWTKVDGRPKYLCTGIAIAPDTVATAASCISGEAEGISLFVSTAVEIDFSSPLEQVILSISAIAKKGIRHDDADLMLIFLKQPLNIEPALILLPAETFQLRFLSDVILAGYGSREKMNKKGASALQKIWGDEPTPKLGQKFIARTRVGAISNKEVLIGKTQEDASPCFGDKGAPIYAHIDLLPGDLGTSERVIGIVTGSEKLRECAHPSSAVRLDAFRDFIDDTMTHGCTSGERSWCKIQGLIKPGNDSESAPETVANNTETSNRATNRVAPEPNQPPSPPDPRPVKTTPPAPQKPQKRRLNVNVEGAGCSCQQVFTHRS